MSGERQKGFTYSIVLHLLVLAFTMWGMPEIFGRKPPPEPASITVELLPISSISNVKNAPRPKSKKIDKPKAQAKPSPPVKKSDPKPVADPIKKDKKKKPEIKKQKKKKKKPKKKPKEEDLAAVLKAVRETAQKEKDKGKSDGGKNSRSDKYDPTLPLSISETDAIRSQFIKCWSVPAGAKDAHELIVTLRVAVERNGAVLSVDLADSSKSRYSRDSFFRAAADSAIRAVRRCSPLENLPADKYNTWRDMELTFDPKEMLY